MLPFPVFVTRPAREAGQWADAFRARGLQAHALPLIAIAPAPDPQALAAYRAGLAGYRSVMFVSANAVHGLLPGARGGWPAGTRAWSTGPGTRQALLEAGVPADLIDAPSAQAAQFDSEALWSLVGPCVAPGDRILIARGGDATGRPAGRDWLATQLEAAGARVDVTVAYVRALPEWGANQRKLALEGARGRAWWIFSSSEGVANLAHLMPHQDWSAAHAVCTHDRIAQAARAIGFGRVEQCRPSLEDVAAFLQSRS